LAAVARAFECVILKNDQHDAEIVVLNNCSTEAYDAVEALCNDNDLRYHFSASNVGFNGNYCRALCAARGDYIWIVSDDDNVSPAAFSIALSLVRSTSPPCLLSFSHHLRRCVYTGTIGDYIQLVAGENALGLTELTLVTNLVYRKDLFDWRLFWQSEPLWFPHAYSVAMRAIHLNSNIVK
jgi:glycosyltransferase involved in cell wall biosynthesis